MDVEARMASDPSLDGCCLVSAFGKLCKPPSDARSGPIQDGCVPGWRVRRLFSTEPLRAVVVRRSANVGNGFRSD
jgi:hypothetical protein